MIGSVSRPADHELSKYLVTAKWLSSVIYLLASIGHKWIGKNDMVKIYAPSRLAKL